MLIRWAPVLLAIGLSLLPACAKAPVTLGSFELKVAPIDLDGGLRRAIPSTKVGLVGLSETGEQKSSETLVVHSAQTGIREGSTELAVDELPLLVINESSLLIRVVGKELHSGSTLYSIEGPNRKELRKEPYPITTAGRTKRTYLYDANSSIITAFGLLNGQLTVEAGNQPLDRFSDVTCGGYVFIQDELNYLFRAAGVWHLASNDGKAKSLPAPMVGMSAAVSNLLDSGTTFERIVFAEDFAVGWTGSNYCLIGPGKVERIPGIDVISTDPKGKLRSRDQQLALEQRPGALRFEGSMQPADRIGVDGMNLPVDSRTVAIVDKWYQRVHLISKK